MQWIYNIHCHCKNQSIWKQSSCLYTSKVHLRVITNTLKRYNLSHLGKRFKDSYSPTGWEREYVLNSKWWLSNGLKFSLVYIWWISRNLIQWILTPMSKFLAMVEIRPIDPSVYLPLYWEQLTSAKVTPRSTAYYTDEMPTTPLHCGFKKLKIPISIAIVWLSKALKISIAKILDWTPDSWLVFHLNPSRFSKYVKVEVQN